VIDDNKEKIEEDIALADSIAREKVQFCILIYKNLIPYYVLTYRAGTGTTLLNLLQGMDLVTLKYRISGCEDKNLLTFDDLDNVRE
jgi:hypothetical protein